MSGVVLLPTVRVPKLAPDAIFAPVVLPIVNPRYVLLRPTPMLMPLLLLIIRGLAPPVTGNGSLLGGTVTPAIVASVALAAWPISFWLFKRVSPPVYAPE